MGSLLEVRNLTIEYKARGAEALRAVDDMSFELEAGEIVGLMGESGCGKSSAALALLGLLSRSDVKISGSARLYERELLGLGEKQLQNLRGSKLSLIFQEPELALNPVVRVGDQIAEVIHAHQPHSWKRCRQEAAAILERVRLEPNSRIFSAYPHELSGGQRQRIVLAQAISCKPKLLVADEPTASLDARSEADFLNLLRDLKNEIGLSVLLISHSPELQAKLADRLLIMKDGRVVERGTVENLFGNSRHPHTRMLLRRKTGANESSKAVTDVELEEQLTR